jgi:hypothetical protein
MDIWELGVAGEEVERFNVVRAYHGEAAEIERRHFGCAKALQQLKARLVMSVVVIHVGVNWPSVNDERYRSAPR